MTEEKPNEIEEPSEKSQNERGVSGSREKSSSEDMVDNTASTSAASEYKDKEAKDAAETGSQPDAPSGDPVTVPSDKPNHENNNEGESGDQKGSEDETSVAYLWARFKSFDKKHKRLVYGGVGVIIAIIVIACLFATHVLCFHDWKQATCTEPETCLICSRTQGEPLGHEWGPEATCTEPQACIVCGEIFVPAKGHEVSEWQIATDSTCSETGTKNGACTVCGEIITETIPMKDHTPGKWEVAENFTITSSGTVIPGTQIVKCTVCGAKIDSKSYTVELTKSQKNALLKAQDYLDYTAFSAKGLKHQLEFEGFSSADAQFAVDNCGADWKQQAALKAEDYLDYTSFSRSGLIGQLEFEGFTHEQAVYGVDQVGL